MTVSDSSRGRWPSSSNRRPLLASRMSQTPFVRPEHAALMTNVFNAWRCV